MLRCDCDEKRQSTNDAIISSHLSARCRKSVYRKNEVEKRAALAKTTDWTNMKLLTCCAWISNQVRVRASRRDALMYKNRTERELGKRRRKLTLTARPVTAQPLLLSPLLLPLHSNERPLCARCVSNPLSAALPLQHSLTIISRAV